MSDVWSALSHPSRRRVLGMLREGAMTVGEIGARFEHSGATLSGHLRILREAGLVTCEADGPRRVYRLNMSVAEDALSGFLSLLRAGEAAGETPATDPKETPS